MAYLIIIINYNYIILSSLLSKIMKTDISFWLYFTLTNLSEINILPSVLLCEHY